MTAATRSGVEEFTGNHQRRTRKNKKDFLKLATLSFMDRQCVCEIETGIAIFLEIALVEFESRSPLSRKLDVDVFGVPFSFLGSSMTNNYSDLSVCKVASILLFRIDPTLENAMVPIVNDLVAVNNLMLSHRPGNTSLVHGQASSRLFYRSPLVSRVN